MLRLFQQNTEKKPQSSNGALDALPNEIMRQILSFLDSPMDLANISRVSKKMNELTKFKNAHGKYELWEKFTLGATKEECAALAASNMQAAQRFISALYNKEKSAQDSRFFVPGRIAILDQPVNGKSLFEKLFHKMGVSGDINNPYITQMDGAPAAIFNINSFNYFKPSVFNFDNKILPWPTLNNIKIILACVHKKEDIDNVLKEFREIYKNKFKKLFTNYFKVPINEFSLNTPLLLFVTQEENKNNLNIPSALNLILNNAETSESFNDKLMQKVFSIATMSIVNYKYRNPHDVLYFISELKAVADLSKTKPELAEIGFQT
ncbi:MAG: hypothetical protein ACD_46C00406G0002 [uncultured bacterium]|nr:MAG: hypothetical protein ACD_46C00406G0002 [uncultured bacterium]